MPVKIARSTPRPSFGLRELLVASHISRLASRDAAKSLLSTLVSESSGECRLRRTPMGSFQWKAINSIGAIFGIAFMLPNLAAAQSQTTATQLVRPL